MSGRSAGLITGRQLAQQPIDIDQAAGADCRLSVVVKDLTNRSGTGVEGSFDVHIGYPGAGAIFDRLGGGCLVRGFYRIAPKLSLRICSIRAHTKMIADLVSTMVGKPYQHGVDKRPERLVMFLGDIGDQRRIIGEAAVQGRVDDIKNIELDLARISIIAPASADFTEQCRHGGPGAVAVKGAAKRIPFILQRLKNPAP